MGRLSPVQLAILCCFAVLCSLQWYHLQNGPTTLFFGKVATTLATTLTTTTTTSTVTEDGNLLLPAELLFRAEREIERYQPPERPRRQIERFRPERLQEEEDERERQRLEQIAQHNKNLLYELRGKAKEGLHQKIHGLKAYGRKHTIDRIYYVNMDKNQNRRVFMESWLPRVAGDIPHSRVAGRKGSEDICIDKYKGKPCIGLSGVHKTFVSILEEHNTTGHTMILEDDFEFTVDNNLQAYIQAVLDLVPDDWDLLRFECWDMEGKIFDRRINEYVFDISWKHIRRMPNCEDLTRSCDWYCGGTHSMLLRGTSAYKLRALWGETPYNDQVDCKLSKDAERFNLTVYCVNAGLGTINENIPGEKTDIIKLREWN